jgi:glycosyltransferase involved in cell wall biosynthesis
VTLSVIVISRNEGRELRRTVQNLEDTLPERGEILVIDDGSTDRSADCLARRRGRVRLKRTRDLGVARARNFGAVLAKGDILVFADAHIRLPRLWWQPLAEILENPKVAAAAPAVSQLDATQPNFEERLLTRAARMALPKERLLTRAAQTAGQGYGLKFKNPAMEVQWLKRQSDAPFPAAILPGCCLAMRRDAFEIAGGWDGGLMHRGGVDNELAVRLSLLGFDLMVAPQVLCQHLFRKVSPYPVGWPQYLHNRLRLAFAHLGSQRLGRVVNALRQHSAFGEALRLVVEGGISARRAEMTARRVRTDDWYFEKFGMKW